MVSTANILDFAVARLTRTECLDAIEGALRGADRRMWLACLNPHSYAIARSDALFARSLRAATWLVADGAGVVLASRLLGARVPERITGSDIFAGLNERMNRSGGYRVYLLGSTSNTLAKIKKRMEQEYPHIEIAGCYSPPFSETYTVDELERMAAAVNASGADVLWVAMTAPKQEKWIAANINKLDIRFAGAVGAVFDFYAGNVSRSSPFFQRIGLEWLPRLIQEPRRLWRRTFISAPIFLCDVLSRVISPRGRA